MNFPQKQFSSPSCILPLPRRGRIKKGVPPPPPKGGGGLRRESSSEGGGEFLFCFICGIIL